MSGWRQQVDGGFATLGRFVIRHRWLTIAAALLPVLLLTAQLRHIRLDTSTEGFLHQDDPAMLEYNAFRDQFGRDELIILALRPPRIFEMHFLETLRSLHRQIEDQVPYLDEVTSLVNARATRGSSGELLVEDLMERWPESEQDLQRLESFVSNNPTYRNLLISEDGRTTTLVIQTSSYSATGEVDDIEAGFEDEDPSEGAGEQRAYLSDEENTEVVRAVEAIVAEYQSGGLPVHLAGSPVVTELVKRSMRSDMTRFIRLTILAIAVFLFILFRRISAVVLPLLVVICSLLSTIGLMAATGTALKLPTTILPSFLLAVGVGDSVHVLALFLRYYDSGASREEAIVRSLEHSGLPIVLTSVTTAGGLLSFAPTALAPISDLGKFAPAGVIIALLLSLILLPALLAAVPLRRPRARSGEEAVARHPLDRIIAAAGDLAIRRPWAVVGTSGLLLVIAIASALRVDFSHNPLTWLPEASPVRRATELIDRELKGSIATEVLLEREGENAWYDPAALERLDSISNYAENYRDGEVFFGRAFSLVDILKEIHRALNDDLAQYYRVPQERNLIAQELLLFENSGSDDLEDVVDSQFSVVRLTLKAPWLDAVSYTRTLPAVKERIESVLGDDTRVVMTGLMPLMFRTMGAVMATMAQSYTLAFLVITCLMILLIGDIRLGLISMLPNLLPIVLALGAMEIFGMPLDVFTLLIGSIALGLAVDDTIHFMHNYRRYLDETGDSSQAIRLTLDSAGRAMLVTTLVLSTGFFIFTLSSMNNIFNFGVLTGSAIIAALLADFLLAPALMQLLHGRQSQGGE